MPNTLQTRPGDVLFYFDSHALTRFIQVGERLEEHSDGPWPYHCAIALNSTEKLEADFLETAIHPIDNNFIVCRPPYPRTTTLARGLMWGRTKVGRPYGWIGVIDQGLRDLTGGRVHLPKFFIEWVNRVMPYCSTLVADVLYHAGFNAIPPYPPPSPADVYIALKQFQVNG